MAVLRGARTLLASQRISVVQFEYNRWWVYARSFLRDAFDFVQPLGYELGKLTPWGVEFYPGWHSDLETFIQGNYVAAAPGASAWMPAVQWWKLGRPMTRARRYQALTLTGAASSSLTVTNRYPPSVMAPTSRSSCCIRLALGSDPPSWARTMLPGEASRSVVSTSPRALLPVT